MKLCDSLDDRVKYRVRFDHTAPFFNNTDRNGDGINPADDPDDLDFCFTTSDTGMMHRKVRGTGPGRMMHRKVRDTGPGSIDMEGDTLIFRVAVDELSPRLAQGDTVYIWADTQHKGILDQVPNRGSGDGCAKPSVPGEILPLTLIDNSLVELSALVPAKFAFVTSTIHNGNLGGLAGADAICQDLADAAGKGAPSLSIWKAWLALPITHKSQSA